MGTIWTAPYSCCRCSFNYIHSLIVLRFSKDHENQPSSPGLNCCHPAELCNDWEVAHIFHLVAHTKQHRRRLGNTVNPFASPFWMQNLGWNKFKCHRRFYCLEGYSIREYMHAYRYYSIRQTWYQTNWRIKSNTILKLYSVM